MTTQFALPFEPEPSYEPIDFIAAPSNEAARAWLDRPGDWPSGRLALWGPEGIGKTHLLRVWAAAHGAQLLDGRSLGTTEPPPPPARPLAIDNADAAAELALLHRLNLAAEAGQPVLLAARTPPGRWPVALPDLLSRLRAITAAAIAAPEDVLLRLLLQRLLLDRQLAVPEPVQAHMLRRLPRTPAALRRAAALLDRAALAAGGPITRRLADAALGPLREDDDAMTTATAASPAAGPIV
jgi:chromosomal replication initiation ATPase DnaA